MKMMKAALAAMAGAGALAFAGAASAATVYNFDVYDAAFSGSLGTVTVDGQGTSTLSFDVVLSSNVYFQAPQNGKLHDSFWFDLTGSPGFDGAVTYNITTPVGGSPFSPATGSLGQGWSSGDYGLQVLGSGYYGGELKFSVTATDGSLLDLASSTHNGKTVYGGADLRQVLETGVVTGPAGFSGPTTAVPEPAVWAMMLVGFGGLGAMLRYRRRELAAA